MLSELGPLLALSARASDGLSGAGRAGVAVLLGRIADAYRQLIAGAGSLPED